MNGDICESYGVRADAIADGLRQRRRQLNAHPIDGGLPGDYAEPCMTCGERIYVTTEPFMGRTVEMCRCGQRLAQRRHEPPPPDGMQLTRRSLHTINRIVRALPDTVIPECLQCGKELDYPRQLKYCSRPCLKAAKKLMGPGIRRRCKQCNIVMPPRNTTSRYCSDNCKQQGKRAADARKSERIRQFYLNRAVQ